MLPILTPGQMAECDRLAISGGVPGTVLMERAGAAVTSRVTRVLDGAYGRRVVVLAGKGNNGGDGLVVARKLHRQGALVRVALAETAVRLTGDSRAMYERLVPSRIPVGLPDVALLADVCRESDVIVDALFGTGFAGSIEGDLAGWVRVANESGRPIVAVDIPSGIDGMTGRNAGACISADLTVAIEALKPGHVLGDGIAASGRIEIAGIGVALDQVEPVALMAEPDDIVGFLPSRKVDAHKWSAGSVLVIAGSRGMSGAAIMTARAALLSGAGIVTVGLPASIQEVVAEATPETMTVGLDETDAGAISADAIDWILEQAHRFSVIAIGPGLGRDDSTAELVADVLTRSDRPVVVDADALNLLGTAAVDVIGGRRGQTVMTPHPGELGRLLGVDATAIESERLDVAKSVADKWGCVVLLKGPRTVIAAPGVPPMVNPTGGPELATAGAGDVLTGVVAALMSAGAPPRDAAVAAAFVHGVAADIAGRPRRGRGVVALDVAQAVPDAISGIEAGRLP